MTRFTAHLNLWMACGCILLGGMGCSQGSDDADLMGQDASEAHIDHASDASAVCIGDHPVQRVLAGASCADRSPTPCVEGPTGPANLSELILERLQGCSIGLIENQIDILFEEGCATRLGLGRAQPTGADADALDCLRQRLEGERWDCITQFAWDCVHYEVSTIAAP